MRPLSFMVAIALLAGCAAGADPKSDEARLLELEAESTERRDSAFQELLRRADISVSRLRAAMGLGEDAGFPVVALLYAQGRGDAVPLDLKVRHLALFEWPRARAAENSVVEPFVRREIEQDLARIGRPALRLLGHALERDVRSEAAAVRILRVILRLPTRASAAEVARLLFATRSLGGSRVCDAAAVALLYLGRQETLLRLESADARLEAARAWWELAKDFDESEWLREAVERLSTPGPEGPVLELLVGREIPDVKTWAEQNRGWRPSAPLSRPEELLPQLALGRARAYDANRRLEDSTGMRVFLPRFHTVAELRSALRLWSAPSDLALRWRRALEVPLLRLSIAVIGPSTQANAPRVRWFSEAHFHPLEEESGDLQIETRTERYALYVQAFEFGTRLICSEFHQARGPGSGTVREFHDAKPMVMFSAPFKAALVAVVEEVAERRAPPSVPVVQAEWRERLRSWQDPDALRALGYFQDPADLAFFKERKAGASLLLLGDPSGIDLNPKLEPHEIEMALRRAAEPRVREYLEALRRPSD